MCQKMKSGTTSEKIESAQTVPDMCKALNTAMHSENLEKIQKLKAQFEAQVAYMEEYYSGASKGEDESPLKAIRDLIHQLGKLKATLKNACNNNRFLEGEPKSFGVEGLDYSTLFDTTDSEALKEVIKKIASDSQSAKDKFLAENEGITDSLIAKDAGDNKSLQTSLQTTQSEFLESYRPDLALVLSPLTKSSQALVLSGAFTQMQSYRRQRACIVELNGAESALASMKSLLSLEALNAQRYEEYYDRIDVFFRHSIEQFKSEIQMSQQRQPQYGDELYDSPRVNAILKRCTVNMPLSVLGSLDVSSPAGAKNFAHLMYRTIAAMEMHNQAVGATEQFFREQSKHSSHIVSQLFQGTLTLEQACQKLLSSEHARDTDALEGKMIGFMMRSCMMNSSTPEGRAQVVANLNLSFVRADRIVWEEASSTGFLATIADSITKIVHNNIIALRASCQTDRSASAAPVLLSTGSSSVASPSASDSEGLEGSLDSPVDPVNAHQSFMTQMTALHKQMQKIRAKPEKIPGEAHNMRHLKEHARLFQKGLKQWKTRSFERCDLTPKANADFNKMVCAYIFDSMKEHQRLVTTLGLGDDRHPLKLSTSWHENLGELRDHSITSENLNAMNDLAKQWEICRVKAAQCMKEQHYHVGDVEEDVYQASIDAFAEERTAIEQKMKTLSEAIGNQIPAPQRFSFERLYANLRTWLAGLQMKFSSQSVQDSQSVWKAKAFSHKHKSVMEKMTSSEESPDSITRPSLLAGPRTHLDDAEMQDVFLRESSPGRGR